MGTAPLLPLILSMALPAMFSMLVQALYNIVDSYFVAKISESALTAVSLAFPIQMLLISFAVGTGIGINSLVSRRLGEGNQAEADSAATHGFWLGIATWVLFGLFGLFFSRLFIGAFTTTPEVLEMGVQYLSIVCIYSFGVFVEVNLEKTLQATGNMIMPMVFQLVGAITNIILDPIFIFGLLGVPAMGVAGAAVATVAGQILAMVVAIITAFFGKHAVNIRFRGFRPHLRTIKNIYAVGVPSIIMQSIGSVMTMGMNGILIAFNETAVAVFGVYYKIQSFVFMPVFGLTHGVMPIMGYNFGARNRHRLLSTLRIGCAIALLIMAIGTALFWIIPDKLLQIFNASPDMLAIGVPALRTISLNFIPAALGILFSTLFQAVGKGVYSLEISVLRQLVVLLPAAWLLSRVSLVAVWYAFPISESFSLAASIGLFLLLYHRTLKTLRHEPTQPAGL